VRPDAHGDLVRTLAAIGILGVFGGVYLVATAMLQVPEAQAMFARFVRRR
jgi:hypothetical protein